MLSMQYIIFPVISWIGGISTQFTDEEAETPRFAVLTEVTEPGLSDIRAHAFSCYATRNRHLPNPLPLLPLARKAGTLPKSWVGDALPVGGGLSES